MKDGKLTLEEGKLKTDTTIKKSAVEGRVIPPEIEKGEWLKRCAARFIEVGGADEETAEQLAEACLESTIEFEDWESTPEDCADGEMSYWRD